MILEILAAAVCVFVVGLILYARWNYGTLESMGLTVVKPLHLFLGNTANCHLEVAHWEDIERMKKYGAIYGVYEGRTPQVHICDAELIKCVMVTDYEYFKDRPELDLGSPFLNEMIDFARYEKWKVLRQMFTPSFTSTKMKAMGQSMDESLIDYVNTLKAEMSKSKSGVLEKYDIARGLFTMLTDLIARCVFSITIDNKSDTNNFFVQTLKKIIEGDNGPDDVTFMKPLSLSFPILSRYDKPIFDPNASEDMRKILKGLVEARKQSGDKKKDFLQQVVEWHDLLDTPEYKNNGITESTLLLQALVFFFAGQDQVGNIVSYALLNICQNKEIEKKVYEEMDKHLEKHDQQLKYENLSELTYLKACLTEATRLVPVFTRSLRMCTKDWEKDGIRIKKGTTVVIPVWAANRNPKYYSNPEEFEPERFMPENKDKLHPYAMASFGFGPKNCVGMKFGNDSLIFSAAHLIKNFRFIDRNSTKLEYSPGNLITSLVAPFYLEIEAK